MIDFSSYVAGWQHRAREEKRQIEERRQKALAEAQKIAGFLGASIGVAKVIGIGSTLDAERFDKRSDIDLVVVGLPKGRYFSTLGEITLMTDFQVDLIPYETAGDFLMQRITEEGVQLWP